MRGDDLPNEIWWLITDFLPDKALHQMMSVHRVFFHVALGRKYKEVRWTKPDETFIHWLSRLQSPIISRYVHKLYIRTWFIAFLLKQDALYWQDTISTKFIQFLYSIFSSWKGFLRLNNSEKGWTNDPLLVQPADHLSSRQIIRYMITAIGGMTNVREFRFEWTDLPLMIDSKPLLKSMGIAFGQNLRKLVLHAHILNFKDLDGITGCIGALDDLELHFDYASNTSSSITNDGNPDDDRSEDQEVIGTVIPFIEKSGKHLQSLLVCSSSSVDLSDFFASLPSMPLLQRFGVRISFEKPHLSDPSHLMAYLKKHSSTLRHIQLSPNLPYSKTGMLQQRKREIWNPINDILVADETLLSNLDSLDIPFVSPHKTLPLLQRSANTLTSLSLTNHTFSSDEIVDVLSLFSRRKPGLQTLYMDSESL